MNTLISTAKPGEMCLDGEACTGGSICRDGMCACSDDEVIIGDKCVTSEGEALQVDRRSERLIRRFRLLKEFLNPPLVSSVQKILLVQATPSVFLISVLVLMAQRCFAESASGKERILI